MKHNRGNDNNRGNDKEYLKGLGIDQAVDTFFGNEKQNTMMHEYFVTGIQDIRGEIAKMPEVLRDKLESDLQLFEKLQEPKFAGLVVGCFENAFANLLMMNMLYLSEGGKKKVAEVWQEELEAGTEGIVMMADATAQYVMESLKRNHIDTWLLYMSYVGDEDAETIWNVVNGDRLDKVDQFLKNLFSNK